MKTIQLSERELSMIFSMLTPPYAVSDTHTDEFNELRNKVFYALRDAQNDEPVSDSYKLPEETGSSLQLRKLIRQRHAEWSDATFGNVGPIGPLKHLSKEALEASDDVIDLSEWADMQFLLWDAQRRAGICDGEITAAMEEKLKVNMARQWPEPKDGEPRFHIKKAPQQEG
ncbi:Eaa prophage protein [Enterobacter hormaechei]|nr:Eaa prophage protein [Enterobacter hormaechei]